MSATTKRKHVTREQLCGDLSPPEEDETIVKLVEGKGHNLHLVKNSDGEQFLVSMPSKFRQAVWAKRGDFLLVKPIAEGIKVKAEITRILDSQSIQYFKKLGFWPKEFGENKAYVDLFDGGNPNRRFVPDSDSSSEDSD